MTVLISFNYSNGCRWIEKVESIQESTDLAAWGIKTLEISDEIWDNYCKFLDLESGWQTLFKNVENEMYYPSTTRQND